MRGWLQAARPLAFVQIGVPVVLGQVLAWWVHGGVSWFVGAWALATGLLVQLFIVFGNDLVDEAVDRRQNAPTPFSGGSRVLVDGRLSRSQLRAGMWLALGALLVATLIFVLRTDRWIVVPLWGAGVGIAWAYSFGPLRLSYRGGGEFAQGLGIGVVLPLVGFAAQAGSLAEFPVRVLVPLTLLGFASNIATALPDAASDAAGEPIKRTWPVRFGVPRARVHALQLVAIAVFMTPFVLPEHPRWVWACVEGPPAIWLLAAWISTRGRELAPRTPMMTLVAIGGATQLVYLGWIVALLTGHSGSS